MLREPLLSLCQGPLLQLQPGAPLELGIQGKLPHLSPPLWAGLDHQTKIAPVKRFAVVYGALTEFHAGN